MAVPAIISLARSLKLTAVAEGVESEEKADVLEVNAQRGPVSSDVALLLDGIQRSVLGARACRRQGS